MAPHTSTEDQQFLDELDKKLWNTAERLRSNLDAAVYKHAVLGLIFLKYVSDSFDLRREELRALFADSESDYYIDRQEYATDDAYEEAIEAELEDRDYFTEKNVFWVPALARWSNIQNNATLPNGTELDPKKLIPLTTDKMAAIKDASFKKLFPNREPIIGLNDEEKRRLAAEINRHFYTFRSVARLIDDALEEVEKENPRLKGIIEKNRYSQLQIEPSRLIGLISEVIASIPFEHASLNAKDILGHVYEYFLGQFALAEGKKGGQYYTPKSIVSLIVEMLEPHKGKVYDPAMGSGGFFVQSESFIEKYEGKIGDISVYGQESNPTTWRLAAMNMAIRGIDFNFGKRPADTFTEDQHQDLRADFVMANPPFNVKEWWSAKLEGDPRWVYGTPSKSNANYAWIQHMLYHLKPTGSTALLLANGSMSSNTNGEGDIRQALIEADRVECILALPSQLFTNTQIPACIWFLTKNKKASGENRDRSHETLFIDARNIGYMKDRVLRDFTVEDSEKLIGTFRKWRRGSDYEDETGFSFSAKLEDMQKADFVLTPGRYVGSVDASEDNEPFAEKFSRLREQLDSKFLSSEKLAKTIDANLEGIGL